jgi:hypothetical protein
MILLNVLNAVFARYIARKDVSSRKKMDIFRLTCTGAKAAVFAAKNVPQK